MTPRRPPLHTAALATALAAALALATPAQIANAEPLAKTFTLDNGLKVVVIPDHRVPIVAHSIWYRVGSVDDGPGLSGRAHFLEHMMFKKSLAYPKGFLDRAVAEAGGLQNATTMVEATNYYQILPKEKLPLMMAIEADRMTGIEFTDAEIETERGAILQERKMRIDSQPYSRLTEAMRSAFYKGTIYELLPIGTEAGIRAVSKDTAFALYRQTYAPNNAVVVLTGDITVEEARSLAEATYAKPAPNPSLAPPATTISLGPLPSTRIVERDPQVTLPSVVKMYRVPGLAHEDRAALLVVMNYLNLITGGLKVDLVDTQRLAAAVSCSLDGMNLANALTVTATAAEGVPLEKVEAALDAFLALVAKEGVPDAEVTRILKALEPATAFQRDDIVELMNHYGSLLATGFDIQWIESEPERRKAATPEAVKRVAATYLDPANALVGELLPAATAASR